LYDNPGRHGGRRRPGRRATRRAFHEAAFVRIVQIARRAAGPVRRSPGQRRRANAGGSPGDARTAPVGLAHPWRLLGLVLAPVQARGADGESRPKTTRRASLAAPRPRPGPAARIGPRPRRMRQDRPGRAGRPGRLPDRSGRNGAPSPDAGRPSGAETAPPRSPRRAPRAHPPPQGPSPTRRLERQGPPPSVNFGSPEPP
jgi:translation initiation factor IF-2